MVLQQSTKKTGRSFTVLMLCNGGEDTEEVANSIVDIKLYQSVNPHESMKVALRTLWQVEEQSNSSMQYIVTHADIVEPLYCGHLGVMVKSLV